MTKYEEDQFSYLALIVDNVPQMLASVMFTIRMNPDNYASAVESYLRTQAVADHARWDRVEVLARSQFRKAVAAATAPVIAELVRHWKMKHDEGNVMAEYLTDEQRAQEAARK